MKPEPIAKTIDEIIGKLLKEKKGRAQEISRALEEILSPKERKHAAAQSAQGGIITLCVSSPAWMYALNQKKSELLEKLREKLGQETIKDIRLKIGKA